MKKDMRQTSAANLHASVVKHLENNYAISETRLQRCQRERKVERERERVRELMDNQRRLNNNPDSDQDPSVARNKPQPQPLGIQKVASGVSDACRGGTAEVDICLW